MQHNSPHQQRGRSISDANVATNLSAAAPPASDQQRRDLTIDQYCAGVAGGDFTILARALTLVESSVPRHQRLAEELLAALLPNTGGAIRIGITGVPGVGKSTFIESLGVHLVGQGKRVAVLAVDPSSDISGGSILGDKTRMNRLAVEPGAFIRPSPSAGTTGGVARKTRECMLLCEAAGYDVVLIETIGVGQSETMVAKITDCFLALMLPGGGDELQAIKRGLLELVDVIAINKADGANRSAAEVAANQFSLALKSLGGRDGETPDVFTCSALNDQGVDIVWHAVERRYMSLKTSGQLIERRNRQNVLWLWATIDDRMQQAVRTHPSVRALHYQLESKVLAGEITPEAAAQQVLDVFGLQ
ncbi:MAG TPA: methylmalonyl Co-A mutase-associated GTPase MeaB, partial [Pirellulales bacterium]